MNIVCELFGDHTFDVQLDAIFEPDFGHEPCLDAAVGVEAMHGNVAQPFNALAARPAMHDIHIVFQVHLYQQRC